jgi:hypothetical protein
MTVLHQVKQFYTQNICLYILKFLNDEEKYGVGIGKFETLDVNNHLLINTFNQNCNLRINTHTCYCMKNKFNHILTLVIKLKVSAGKNTHETYGRMEKSRPRFTETLK